MSPSKQSTLLAAVLAAAIHIHSANAQFGSPNTNRRGRGRRLVGGAIAGIVIGALVFILFILLMLFLCCRRRRSRASAVGPPPTQPARPGFFGRFGGRGGQAGAPGMAQAGGYNNGAGMGPGVGQDYQPPMAPPTTHQHGNQFAGGFHKNGAVA